MAWQTMESAPKGSYETVNTGKGMREVFRKEWVHTWRKDGRRTNSYWSPETKAWVGYTKDAPPDMWHPYPADPVQS